jgi:hypothetical protein
MEGGDDGFRRNSTLLGTLLVSPNEAMKAPKVLMKFLITLLSRVGTSVALVLTWCRLMYQTTTGKDLKQGCSEDEDLCEVKMHARIISQTCPLHVSMLLQNFNNVLKIKC